MTFLSNQSSKKYVWHGVQKLRIHIFENHTLKGKYSDAFFVYAIWPCWSWQYGGASRRLFELQNVPLEDAHIRYSYTLPFFRGVRFFTRKSPFQDIWDFEWMSFEPPLKKELFYMFINNSFSNTFQLNFQVAQDIFDTR